MYWVGANSSGQQINQYYPASPSQATIEYTVVGYPIGPPPPQPPSPPSNLVITNAGQVNQNPNLSWSASPTSGVTYKVERCDTGNPPGTLPCNWSVIASNLTVTTYTDTFVIIQPVGTGNEFRYRVKANKAGLDSVPSNSVITQGESPQKNGAEGKETSKEIDALPTTFALEQNFPNPFNPVTQIRFALPEVATVEITVLDVLGREVMALQRGRLSAGHYQVSWDGRDASVSSGLYLYMMNAVGASGARFSRTMKMVLMK